MGIKKNKQTQKAIFIWQEEELLRDGKVRGKDNSSEGLFIQNEKIKVHNEISKENYAFLCTLKHPDTLYRDLFFFFCQHWLNFCIWMSKKTSFTNNSHDRQLMWCEPVNMATEHVWAKKRLINCSYKYTNPKETMLLL